MLHITLAAFAALFVTASCLADETAHRILTADSSSGRIAIIAEDGSTEWEYEIGPLHDLHVLENGHLLFQTDWTGVSSRSIPARMKSSGSTMPP